MKSIIILLLTAVAVMADIPTGTVTRSVSVYTNTGLLVDTNFTRANGILVKSEPIEGYHPEIAVSRDRIAKSFEVTGTTGPDITGTYVDIGIFAEHTLYSNITRTAIAFWRSDNFQWYIAATNDHIFGMGIPVWNSWNLNGDEPWTAQTYQDAQWNGSTGTPVLVDTSSWRTNTAGAAYTTNNATWRTNQFLGIDGSTNTIIYLGAP